MLFLYFKHIRIFFKQQESSQLDEKAGDEINVHDHEHSFNKTIFCVIMFSVHEDIGTCIDYCVTQTNGFLYYIKRAQSDSEVRGCGSMNFFLHGTQCIR